MSDATTFKSRSRTSNKFWKITSLVALLVLLTGLITPILSGTAYADTGIVKTGQIGNNTVATQYPSDTAVDSDGNVYIFSYITNSIIKLSSTGAFITQWGGLGGADGQFREAYSLAIDANDNVYVSDTGNNRIQKFSSDGTFLAKWGSSDIGPYGGGSASGQGDGEFSYPSDITIDANGNVYVYDDSNYRIKKMSSTGDVISIWGWGVQDGSSAYQICTSGCQAGQAYGSADEIGMIYSIHGLASDASGNIYFGDSYRRIQKFDSSGNFMSTFGWGVQDGSSSFQICTSGCQQGVSGTGQGQFEYIGGLTIDSDGNIFVADSDTSGRIQKFDSSANYVTQWGGERKCAYNGDAIEPGKFCNPMGLSVDNDDNVLVADPENNNVQKFNNSGTYLESYGSTGLSNGAFAQPYGNAVDGAGNVYVTDVFNNRVQKFDSSGNFITKWGTRGGGNGEFNAPIGVAVDSANNVYVTEVYNNRVQKFDANGNFITKWGGTSSGSYGSYGPYGETESGGGDGEFYNPTGIVVDSSNNVYVADTSNHRIQKFSSSGTFITKWGSADIGSYGSSNPGSGNGEFTYPGGIAIDSGNNIYVADNQNDRIQKFTSTGAFVQNIGSTGSNNGQLNKPTGLAVDDSNNIYVADTENMRIQKFNSSGSYESQYALSTFSPYLPYSITGITAASNGRLYIGEGAQGRVSVLCDNDESSDGCTLGASSGAVIVPNAVNTKPISLTQTGCSTITNAASSVSSALSVKDSINTYPVGLVSFTLTGCSSGGSSTVKVTFAGVSNPKAVKLRKYNATTKQYSNVDNAVITASSLSGEPAVQAEYTIVDGGALDGDGQANGSIEDPVGLIAVSGGSLAETGIIAVSTTMLLGLMLGSLAYAYVDYRKHKGPLQAIDTTVRYTFAHHVKVVTIPLLKYRLQLQVEKVDNSMIKKF